MQSVTIEAWGNQTAPIRAAATDAAAPGAGAAGQLAPVAATTLRGTVRITNGGPRFLVLDMVTVRICSPDHEHLRAAAACDDADMTLAPGGGTACSWEAPLPEGRTADMYSGLTR
jgi:hypothetical protein